MTTIAPLPALPARAVEVSEFDHLGTRFNPSIAHQSYCR